MFCKIYFGIYMLNFVYQEAGSEILQKCYNSMIKVLNKEWLNHAEKRECVESILRHYY